MKQLKKTGLVFAFSTATALLGCGSGSDNNDDSVSGGGGDNGAVSGAVNAPAGAVAMFEQKDAFRIAMEFFITPVAAAITGLEPVTGADVELIRIDDDGQQLGDVLATARTSSTGEYTLTLPAGVDLSGNLIVRISGTGAAEMRAQVVEREVDINPVSEFVLQSFIDSGADLDTLTTASVIKLTGQVEEFDLAAGADLSEMLAQLEEETGSFVDARIDVITTASGDAATVAGEYRNTAIQFGLHDDDGQYGVGAFSMNLWNIDSISLADGGAGTIGITIGGEENAWSNLARFDTGYTLTYFSEIDGEGDTGSALLGDDGVLSVESEFEEEIDGDFAWRYPPGIKRFQKAKNSYFFIGLGEEAGVRYKTVDTDDDGVKDALDPAQREGDEVYRGLEIVVKKPANAGVTDLTGDFGRIYLGVMQNNSGQIEVETERNQLSFSGTGTIDATAATYRRLESTNAGTSSYSTDTTQAESGISFTLSANGDIPTVGGESADGLINEGFDFLVFNKPRATDDANPEDDQYQEVLYGTTLAVKLPDQLLDITNKTYRVLFLGVEFDGSNIAMTNTRFDTQLEITGVTAGVLNGETSTVSKAGRAAEVVGSSETETDLPVTVSLASNGEMSLTFADDAGTSQMDGFLNQDGSLGVFEATYTPNGGTTTELGVMILMEI